jgi:hypothetical protein
MKAIRRVHRFRASQLIQDSPGLPFGTAGRAEKDVLCGFLSFLIDILSKSQDFLMLVRQNGQDRVHPFAATTLGPGSRRESGSGFPAFFYFAAHA